MNTLYYIYRRPLREGLIMHECNTLYLHEPVPQTAKATKLIIVPQGLWNIIFTAFHVNPIGGHMSLYHTYHKLRLRYHWPSMYQYVRAMIKRCSACLMANSTARPNAELQYSFPVDAPFKIIHIDIYKAGDIITFDNVKALLIVLDHMSTFAITEPLQELHSKALAKLLAKVLLQHGLCHTIVVDADSKFKKEFEEVARLLQINLHQLSRGNHNGMLVERFNRFLNKALRVFVNDKDSVQTFVEGSYLSTFAWNSAPVSGTDISRSLVALGREFSFPIDFTVPQKFSLDLSPSAVESYASTLSSTLSKSREIFEILINEHRAYHRELRNSQRSLS